MKKITSLLFFVFIPLCSYSQIDTTDWFPMQTGNYWEYRDNAGSAQKLFIKIIGDTTLNNGEDYKIFRSYYNDWTWFTDSYYRKEVGNKICEYAFDPGCLNSERLLYDFDVKDSTIWPSCITIPPFNIYIALWYSSEEFFPFYPVPLQSKTFTYVTIDTSIIPNDTSWFFLGFEKVAKGIGMHENLYDFSPWYYLVGAIINGKTYGVITDVNLQQIQPTEYQLYQNYPNPFNPGTIIKYEVPQISYVKIEVFDVLGRVIKVLVDEQKTPGRYEIKLDASSLASGIYYYRIKANEFVQTKKMMLIK